MKDIEDVPSRKAIDDNESLSTVVATKKDIKTMLFEHATNKRKSDLNEESSLILESQWVYLERHMLYHVMRSTSGIHEKSRMKTIICVSVRILQKTLKT